MLVQVDKVFVTPSPLSELVWSPRKGLGLISTDFSSAEYKTSLWWNTESFNFIFSEAGCGPIGDDCGVGTMVEGTLCSTQLVPNSSTINNMDDSSPGRMVPTSIRTRGQDSVSRDETRGFQGTTELTIMNVNYQGNEQFEDKQISISSCRNSETNEDLLDSAAKSVNGVHIIGPSNGQTSGSFPSTSEEVRVNAEKVEINRDGYNFGTNVHTDVGKKIHQSSQFVEHMDSETELNGNNPSERLSQTRGDIDAEGTPIVDSKNLNKQFPPLSTYFPPLAESSRAINSTSSCQPLYLFSHLPQHQGRVADAGRIGPSDDHRGDFQESLAKNNFRVVESSPEKAEIDLNRRKEKEIVLGKHASFSKKTNDSHESVESCNNKEFSSMKRAWCFEEHNEDLASKKLKELDNGNSSSGCIFGQGSSFMNWIAGVAKGLSSSVPAEATSTYASKPSDNKFNEKEGSHRTAGFHAFVQALYSRKTNAQHTIHNHESNWEFSGPKKHKITKKTSAIFYNEENLNIQAPIPLSAFKAGECPLEEEYPARNQKGLASSSAVPVPLIGNSRDIGSNRCIPFKSTSSSSSIRNTTTPHEDNKDSAKLEAPNKSNELLHMSGGTGFLGSIWITRLCPKVTPLAHAMQVDQVPSSTTEKQVLIYTQNGENMCLENEERKYSTENQQFTDLLGCSSSIEAGNDQKFKPKLNPILPSQRLKKLEPMASIFAKRLDAIRHIKPSVPMDDVSTSTSTCFFCGRTGHCLKECLEIKGSELEILQKNINSCDNTWKSSCFCLRCFHLGHWAITCPLVSQKTSNHQKAAVHQIINVNNDKVRDGPVQSKSLATNHSKRSPIGDGFNVEFLPNVKMAMDDWDLSPGKNERHSSEEHKFSKQVVSHSAGETLSAKHVIPVYDFMRKEVVEERARIFEGIRKLRLSRADIVRYHKTWKSSSSLEGFFVRVRLGKNEGRIGGGSYCVACICGESLEQPPRISRSHISVTIVGFKYLIDCRFVSNNNFMEDELKAWWSATTKAGEKLPPVDELARKLEVRKALNM